MAIKSINTLSRPLSDVLSEDIRPANVKLVDYLVDTTEYESGLPLQDQPSSIYLYEISFNVDIERVIDTGIEGYQLKIVNPLNEEVLIGDPALRTGGELFTYQAFFTEDFPDPTDTGDRDFDTIISKIRQVQTVLLSEDLADAGNISAPTISSEAYESLGAPSATGILGSGRREGTTPSSTFLEILESGEDPSEEAALTMPAFALSKSKVWDSLVNDEQSTITYSFTPRGDKSSLTAMRSEIKNRKKTRSRLGYRVENQIVSPPAEQGLAILGKNCQIQNSLFKCIRRVEVPKTFVANDPQFLKFVFEPITTKDPGTGPGFEGIEVPRPTEIEHQLATVSKNLFIPEIPPEIEVLSSFRGKATIRVSRGDPATKRVAIVNKVYNGLVGRIEFDFANYYDIDFKDVEAEQKILDIECRNFEPYITSLVAIAINGNDYSVSSTKVLTSLPTKECRTGFKTNNVSLMAINVTEGIQVRVDLNGTKPVKVCLYREDFSLGTNSPSKITKVREVYSPSRSIDFIDGSTRPNMTYKYYTVQTISEPGSTIHEDVLSSDYEIIQRKQYDEGSIYKVNVERGEQTLSSRTFRPSVKVAEKEYTRVLDALKRSKYASDILKNFTNQLQPLLFEALPIFKVERVNRDTGQRQYMGTALPNQDYVDNTHINMTEAYSYIFKLCIFDPLGIKAFSDNFYEVTPKERAYIANQIKKMTGAEPSYGRATLDQLETGIETLVNVPRGTQSVTVQNLTHTIINEGFNFGSTSLKLKWSIPLEQSLATDGFFVVCRYQGMETIVGSVPANPIKTNNYCFIESEFINEVGTKEYFVIARFVDFNLSAPSNSVTLTKNSSLPDDVMRRSRLSSRSGDRTSLKSLSTLGIADAFKGRS